MSWGPPPQVALKHWCLTHQSPDAHISRSLSVAILFPPGLQWSNLWHAENSSNSLGEAVGTLLCPNLVECFVRWQWKGLEGDQNACKRRFWAFGICALCWSSTLWQMMVAQLLAVPCFLLLWRYLEQAWAKRIGDGRWIPVIVGIQSSPLWTPRIAWIVAPRPHNIWSTQMLEGGATWLWEPRRQPTFVGWTSLVPRSTTLKTWNEEHNSELLIQNGLG